MKRKDRESGNGLPSRDHCAKGAVKRNDHTENTCDLFLEDGNTCSSDEWRPTVPHDDLPEEYRFLSKLEEIIMFMEISGKEDKKIQESLKEVYGIDITVTKISRMIRSVRDRIRQWQTRELETAYPVVHFDGVQSAVNLCGILTNRYSYVAVGITFDGIKDLLGIWTSSGDPDEFHSRILSDLRQRGVRDIFLSFTDYSKDFSRAFSRHYPHTRVHASVAGLIRDSLHYLPSHKRQQMVKDLKCVYQSATPREAERHLAVLREKWHVTGSAFAQCWQDNWQMFEPVFHLPVETRRAFFMLNVIESLNIAVRKVMRNRRLFRSDDVLFRSLFLTLHSFIPKWPQSIRNWNTAYSWLSNTFHDRMTIC